MLAHPRLFLSLTTRPLHLAAFIAAVSALLVLSLAAPAFAQNETEEDVTDWVLVPNVEAAYVAGKRTDGIGGLHGLLIRSTCPYAESPAWSKPRGWNETDTWIELRTLKRFRRDGRSPNERRSRLVGPRWVRSRVLLVSEAINCQQSQPILLDTRDNQFVHWSSVWTDNLNSESQTLYAIRGMRRYLRRTKSLQLQVWVGDISGTHRRLVRQTKLPVLRPPLRYCEGVEDESGDASSGTLSGNTPPTAAWAFYQLDYRGGCRMFLDPNTTESCCGVTSDDEGDRIKLTVWLNGNPVFESPYRKVAGYDGAEVLDEWQANLQPGDVVTARWTDERGAWTQHRSVIKRKLQPR